ncbi:MAG: hypothetical protein WDO06_01715 [Actinomycetota bacterium]
MPSFSADQLILNTSNISQERLDGEVVVISFNTGKYFSAKGTAADIFWLVQYGVDQSFWPEIFQAHFPNFDAATSGISAFLESAVSEELFLPLATPSLEKISLPLDYERGEWEAPRLVVFEDLQDLLLLDPVHDTSIEGWPSPKDE